MIWHGNQVYLGLYLHFASLSYSLLNFNIEVSWRGWAKLSGGTCCLASGASLLLKACRDGASASSGGNNPRWQRVPTSSGGNNPRRQQVPTSSGGNNPRRRRVPTSSGGNNPRRQQVPTSSGGNNPRRQRVPTSSGGNEFQLSMTLGIRFTFLLRGVPHHHHHHHPPPPTADGQFSRAWIIQGHCAEPSARPTTHLTPQYCGTLLPSRSTKGIVSQATLWQALNRHNISAETKQKTLLSNENEGTKPCCPMKMRGQNPAVQWKWGTFPARLREEGPVFRTPDVQQCKDTVQEKTAVWSGGERLLASFCFITFCRNNVPKASVRSLNGEQQFSQSERKEFERGTTVLQSEHKEFEWGTTVFPKQARGVWTGNNSVPKVSTRSLNGEQCERCLWEEAAFQF